MFENNLIPFEGWWKPTLTTFRGLSNVFDEIGKDFGKEKFVKNGNSYDLPLEFDDENENISWTIDDSEREISVSIYPKKKANVRRFVNISLTIPEDADIDTCTHAYDDDKKTVTFSFNAIEKKEKVCERKCEGDEGKKPCEPVKAVDVKCYTQKIDELADAKEKLEAENRELRAKLEAQNDYVKQIIDKYEKVKEIFTK